MGVTRQDYIIYGWKLPYEFRKEHGDLWDDKFLPYIEGHPGVEYSMIIDGMSGEYVVFGLRLGISDDDNGEGWNFTMLNFRFDTNKVMQKYREVFEYEGPLDDPYLFIFSHYR